MIKNISAKTLSISGLAPKQVRECKPDPGKHVLIHDGKKIIVRHGPEAHTGCGNPDYEMITGTPEEIDNEVAKLGLKTQEQVMDEESESRIITPEDGLIHV